MEDYDLSIRIKKLGYKIKMIDTPILASSRRLIKNGIIKMIFKMQFLQFKYRHKFDINKIYKEYES